MARKLKRPKPRNARKNLQGGRPLRNAPRRAAGSPNPKAMGIDPRGFGLGSNFFNQSDQAGHQFGLPLSGAYEEGVRGLNDELTQALAAFAGLKPQIQSQGRLGMERLKTDFGRDMDDLRENLIGRGIYHSGIRLDDERELGNLYERQQQDLAFGVQSQLADLANQEAQARLGHERGLQELMLDIANQEAQLGPYSAAPSYLGPSFKPEDLGGGGGGGGGRGGRRGNRGGAKKRKKNRR